MSAHHDSKWEVVIGLEIHVQLATASKIFSPAGTAFGAEPNTQACHIDLAMPGVLPSLNEKVVEMAVRFGLGIGAKINHKSVFDRKNYFYPDLPKGYQISQMDTPIVGEGQVTISLDDGSQKVVGVTRAHLEEDAGKSLHEDFFGQSGIDLNRAGTPLLEIVSEPDMRSAQEAVAYLKKMHGLIRYLEISDGNMSQGSMRCDANVSIRPHGSNKLGTRTEIKNVNSFRFVEKAIEYEVQRHIDIIESGGEIAQETRLYDSAKNETRSMRSKEFANDYRYFPEPDLLPLQIDQAYIDDIASRLPELPDQKCVRFQAQYQLSEYDASVLCANRSLANYFEQVVEACKDAKLATNWVMGELSGALNKHQLEIEDSPISSEKLAGLMVRISDKTISGKIAKQIFEDLWQGADSADSVIEAKGLKQVTDSSEIEAFVQQVIDSSPEQVAQYQEGKTKLMGFFVGQVMKISKGKANPEMVNQIIRSKIG